MLSAEIINQHAKDDLYMYLCSMQMPKTWFCCGPGHIVLTYKWHKNKWFNYIIWRKKI